MIMRSPIPLYAEHTEAEAEQWELALEMVRRGALVACAPALAKRLIAAGGHPNGLLISSFIPDDRIVVVRR